MAEPIPPPVTDASIVFVLDQFPELSQTFVLDQIDWLVNRGFDVRLLAMARNPGEIGDARAINLAERATYVQDHPIVRMTRGAVLPRPLRWRLQSLAIRIVDWSVLRRAGLVICHFGPMGRRAAAALPKARARRTLWTIFHGYDVSSYLQLHGDTVYNRLLRVGARFFAVSRFWIDRLRPLGAPRGRTDVLRMGVDLDKLPYRERLGSGGPARVLTVCRLVEKKGLEYALRALAQTQSDWRYTIVGSGPLDAELRGLAGSLGIAGRVTFAGAQPPDEVKRRLDDADIFLLPSVTAESGDQEGVPVALMEAMAVGLPVVSSVHSGIPELIDHGISGLLAPERDIDMLASHLTVLIGDPERRRGLATKARRAVELEFNQQRIMAEFEAMVREKLNYGP